MSIDNFSNWLYNQIKFSNITSNKSKFLIFFLLIIKAIYGHTYIFDILCILYTVVVLTYVTNDIDKGNNIMENQSTKKYGLIGLLVYFISKNNFINKNVNLDGLLIKTLTMINNTLTGTIAIL